MAEEQKAKYEIIYDMGTELYIAKVQLAELKEQDINARIVVLRLSVLLPMSSVRSSWRHWISTSSLRTSGT